MAFGSDDLDPKRSREIGSTDAPVIKIGKHNSKLSTACPFPNRFVGDEA